MAGLSQKEYNEQVDESLILFGGSAPCANIDPRMWADFKELYKQYNAVTPKVINWSYDQVFEWMEEYSQVEKESKKNQ